MNNAGNNRILMHVFWESVVLPCLYATRARHIVQISTSDKRGTEKILQYCIKNKAELFILDPHPHTDVMELFHEQADFFLLWKDEPTKALELLPNYDTLLIEDGRDSEVLLEQLNANLLKPQNPATVFIYHVTRKTVEHWARENPIYNTCYIPLFDGLAVLANPDSPFMFRLNEIATALSSIHEINSINANIAEIVCSLYEHTTNQSEIIERAKNENGDLKRELRKRSQQLEKQKQRVTKLKHSWRYEAGGLFAKPLTPVAMLKLPHRVKTRRKKFELRTQAGRKSSTRYSYEEIIERNRNLLRRTQQASFQEETLVSIVVCSHNGHDHLQRLFSSLEKHPILTPYEFVLVDNASTDETGKLIAEKATRHDIALINNQKNETFSKACNQGAAIAQGSFLLFLNNDTEVIPGALDELLLVALENEDAGAIGAKLVYPQIPDDSPNVGKSYLIQHDGIRFKSGTFKRKPFIRPYNAGNGDQPFKDSEAPYEEVGAVTAACLLVKKDAFDKVGGFDEGYVYEYEDVDLCLKLHRAGYRNFLCRTALLFHHEFGTQGTQNKAEVAERRRANWTLYQRKWQQYLARAILNELENEGGKRIFTESSDLVNADELRAMCPADPQLDERKIAIYTPCNAWENAESWGDYHFARALKKYFARKGYTAEIRIPQDWYTPFDGKFIIALQGLSHYVPDALHVNIMWNISHPQDIEICEYDRYDFVFTASKQWTEHIRPLIHIPVQTMYQCTDPELFHPEGMAWKHCELLFVGNTRGVFREIVRELIPAQHNLVLYGQGWEEFVDGSLIDGENVPNRLLPAAYRSCDILLNDHWEDMKLHGFISNRIFDGLAAGAFIISDKVIGLQDVLGDCVATYVDGTDLHKKVNYYLDNEQARRALTSKGRQRVLSEHTFEKRVEQFVQAIKSLNML